jgi:hypothetical protein
MAVLVAVAALAGGVSGGEWQRHRLAALVMGATFLLLLGVEAMLLFCVSCQLPLRTHCAPILSNTTSAGVVNTTEEKVPNDEKLLFL